MLKSIKQVAIFELYWFKSTRITKFKEYMRIQFPKLFIACCSVGAIIGVNTYIKEVRQKTSQDGVLKSYNLPNDEYVKLSKRAGKDVADFTKIADSLAVDKKLKYAFELGQKSASDHSITIKNALKQISKLK